MIKHSIVSQWQLTEILIVMEDVFSWKVRVQPCLTSRPFDLFCCDDSNQCTKYKYNIDKLVILTYTLHTYCQGSDWTELKSSVQFKSSLFWWTLNWTQITFLLKELELNLVHLLSEPELKWTEKFSSFFYHKIQGFWAYFCSKNAGTIAIFYK